MVLITELAQQLYCHACWYLLLEGEMSRAEPGGKGDTVRISVQSQNDNLKLMLMLGNSHDCKNAMLGWLLPLGIIAAQHRNQTKKKKKIIIQ